MLLVNMPKESETRRTAWIKLSERWVPPWVNSSKLGLTSDLKHTQDRGNCSEHWLSQMVTMNRAPQRRSDGPLSTKTGRQIHDSGNEKTRNQGDLERTLG